MAPGTDKDSPTNHLIVYDIEIEKPLAEMPGDCDDDRWQAVRDGEAGISAIVLYDNQSQRYHIYGKESLDEAVDHLNTADLLISFNGITFDSEVIHGVTGRYITVAQYDILQEIWKALGHKQKGFRLQEVATRTLGLSKNANGEGAPTMAKKGHWATLFDYCLNDVHITRALFNHTVTKGGIADKDGNLLHLARPWFEEVI